MEEALLEAVGNVYIDKVESNTLHSTTKGGASAYNIEYIYLTGIFPLLSSLLFINSNYRMLIFSICLYLIIEWLNARYLDITINGLITYTNFLGMFLRSLMIISFLVYYFSKLRYAKNVSYITLFVILAHYAYEKIMIFLGTDTIEYNSTGKKNFLSHEIINIILGLIIIVVGVVFKFRNLHSKGK